MENTNRYFSRKGYERDTFDRKFISSFGPVLLLFGFAISGGVYIINRTDITLNTPDYNSFSYLALVWFFSVFTAFVFTAIQMYSSYKTAYKIKFEKDDLSEMLAQLEEIIKNNPDFEKFQESDKQAGIIMKMNSASSDKSQSISNKLALSELYDEFLDKLNSIGKYRK